MQEERRRLSRFLHDTASQNLVAVTFSLGRIQQNMPAARFESALESTQSLLDQCCRDIRMLSYILVPPLFEELGLIAAFEWFGGRLQREAGMEVELSFDPLPIVPPLEIQSILFAVLQACVARSVLHIRKTKKTVLLRQDGNRLLFRYENAWGTDRPDPDEKDKLLRDFAIIAESLKQISGTFDVEQTDLSISVVASVPMPEGSGGNPS